MAQTQSQEGMVEEFLRERREETQRDADAHPTTMTREQFDARLKLLHERTLQGQAKSRAAKQATKQQEAQREERRAA